MGFQDLPEFPQGGIARAESGNQGIPPESFQQALVDTGLRLIQDSKRPEDSPAVQAALGAEVDTLLGAMGQGQPPVAPAAPQAQQPQAPAQNPFFADTARTTSPEPSGPITPERIQRIMEKYSSPEELAKAYAHTDAARTRAQQDRATELTALRSTVESLQSEIMALRNAAEEIGTGQTFQPQTTGTGVPTPESTSELYFKDPVGTLTPVMKQIVQEVVRDNLLAYTDAQTRYQQEVSFEEYRKSKAQELEQMRPFVDQIYMEDREVFESIEPKASLDLLLKRAHERQDALRGRLFFEEMTQISGGKPVNPGILSNAAPAQTGALPAMGMGGNRVQSNQNQSNGNWSNTRSMTDLWKSRSDSVDEMSALTRVLKERGFGEDIPI